MYTERGYTLNAEYINTEHTLLRVEYISCCTNTELLPQQLSSFLMPFTCIFSPSAKIVSAVYVTHSHEKVLSCSMLQASFSGTLPPNSAIIGYIIQYLCYQLPTEIAPPLRLMLSMPLIKFAESLGIKTVVM